MKLGVLVPLTRTASPEFLRVLGVTAEEVGFNSLFVGEHVVMTDQMDSTTDVYEDGQMQHEDAADNVELDPFTSLAYLASITNTIKLGTGIVVLPQRHPVYTAKEAANVDGLSDGRLILGVGLGWVREEYDVLAAPFAKRGARSSSYINVMKSLWCDDPSEYKDEFYTLPSCRFFPKPVQSPHPPIIFGGASGPSFKRVAEQCQGWFSLGASPEQLAPQIASLDTALAEAGRARSDITVYASPYGHDYDQDMLKQYADMGVDEVILLHFAKTPEEVEALLQDLASKFLSYATSL